MGAVVEEKTLTTGDCCNRSVSYKPRYRIAVYRTLTAELIEGLFSILAIRQFYKVKGEQ